MEKINSMHKQANSTDDCATEAIYGSLDGEDDDEHSRVDFYL